MYNKLISLLSLISFSSFVSSSVTKFTISSCGTATDIAQNIELDVEPVLPQSDFTLYLNADLTKEVNSGTSKYSVTYNFIKLNPTINDLCTEIANSNITCPLSGHISSKSKSSIPIDLSGSLVITNEWFNQENDRILCMKFNIKS